MFRKVTIIQGISTRNLSFFMKTDPKTLAAKNNEVENLRPFKDIPAPPSLPFLKQSHHYWPGGMFYNLSGNDLWNKIYENYGPITVMKYPFKKTSVLIIDGESIQKVMQGESWAPVRKEFQILDYYRRYYRKTETPITLGLATEQGEAWRKYRVMANQILMKPKVVETYSETLHDISLHMVKRLRAKRDSENRMPEDIDHDFKLWAMESVSSIALGQRLGCLNLELTENPATMILLKCIDDLMMYLDKLDYETSPWKYIPTITYTKAMKNFEKLDSVLKYFIEKGMEDYRKNATNNSNEPASALKQLMDIDEYFAMVMAGDMLMAGVDTTSSALLRTLYMLAKHSDKQEEVRDAVLKKQDKKCLKACIKEALRLMPLHAGIVRETTKSYNLLGYEIPTGTEIHFCNQYLTMSEKNYPKPKEFIPERWTVEANHPLYYGKAHPYAYAPFGLGTRSCVGRRVAEMEMVILLEEIIKNFHIEWHGPPLIISGAVINVTKGPFKFVLKDL